MGSGDHLWGQIGVLVYPTAGKQTREDTLGCRETSSTITRGGKPCCKGGHTVSRQQGGLYQPDIPYPKIRWLMAPVINLKSCTEHVCDYSSFQNGINQDSKGLKQGVDWLIKLDLKDAYLMVPLHSSHQVKAFNR